MEIFSQLDIEKITKEKVKSYYDTAIDNLKNLIRPEERKAELYNFASYLMNRKK